MQPFYRGKFVRAFALMSVAWICGALPVQAQTETAPPSIETIIRKAISWHPSIVEAASRLRESEGMIEAAKAPGRPQISAGISSGYNNYGSGGSWQPRANAALEQRLWDFGKVKNEIRVAEADSQARKVQVIQAVDSLALETLLAVLEIRRSQDILKAAQAQLDAIKSITSLVQEREKQGAATRSDLLQALSRVDAAQSTIQAFQADLKRWETTLSYLMGPDQPHTAIPDQQIPRINTACLDSDILWEDVPSLQYARAQMERAEASHKRERSDSYPTVSFGMNAQTDITKPLHDQRSDYNVGLNVSSSVFDGGRTRARQNSASYALKAAEAGYQSALTEARKLLSEASVQYLDLQTRLGTLRQRHEKMQETRELYRLQYLEMGTRSLVDLLNSEQEFAQAHFDRINAVHDISRLGANCLSVKGQMREAFGLSGEQLEGVTL